MLRKLPGVNVTVVDFARLPFAGQVGVVAAHDFLIGMHGAGLSHLLWLPDHAAVLELRPKTDMGWFCFQHMAEWRGFDFRLWENRQHPVNYREDSDGDYTYVDPQQFRSVVTDMLRGVRARKQQR